jgi:hypothetical protein
MCESVHYGVRKDAKMITETVTLDSIASTLAGKAGLLWDTLADHPGYLKAVWREEARRVVNRVAPDAIIQPVALDRKSGRIGPVILNLRRMVA